MPPRPNPLMPLADIGIDRAGQLRGDADMQARLRDHVKARVIVLYKGMPFIDAEGGLQALGGEAFALPAAHTLFLGLEDGTGAPLFALDLAREHERDAEIELAGRAGRFADFRMAAVAGFSAFDAGLAATARAIFGWHATHGFCSRCGAASLAAEAGWKRACPACCADHFPRTDPVVIMVSTYKGKALLGRQARWPPGQYSCLAGFVEPGESLEQAAYRETLEESGIRTRVDTARYLFSQPWPFASSLMMGLILEAETDRIEVDRNEIEHARWFTREELTAMLEGRHPAFRCPPPIAIAHHVIRAFVDTES